MYKIGHVYSNLGVLHCIHCMNAMVMFTGTYTSPSKITMTSKENSESLCSSMISWCMLTQALLATWELAGY